MSDTQKNEQSSQDAGQSRIGSSDLLDIYSDEVADLRHELQNLKVLFIAAIKTNGGKLVVNDSEIQSVTGREKLHRYNDSSKGQVVFSVQP